MTDKDMSTDLPAELKDKLAALDNSLTNLESSLQPLLNTSLSEMNSKLEALDRAKMDLIAVYTVNSLFWVYLNVNGVNPKDHAIKQELDRIRGYMGRVQEIQDKVKAPKLDKPAAKRFVKSALWQAALKQALPHPDKSSTEINQPINTIAKDSPNTSSQSKGDKPQKQSLWKAAQKKNTASSSNKRTAKNTESNTSNKKKKKKMTR